MQERGVVSAGIIVVVILVIYGYYLGNRQRYAWSATVITNVNGQVLVAVPSTVNRYNNSFQHTMHGGNGHIIDANENFISLQPNGMAAGSINVTGGVSTPTVSLLLNVCNYMKPTSAPGDVIKVSTKLNPMNIGNGNGN